jgi:hypothetical protein
VYLLTNALVEEKLKELVSNTLPIQQLTAIKMAMNKCLPMSDRCRIWHENPDIPIFSTKFCFAQNTNRQSGRHSCKPS